MEIPAKALPEVKEAWEEEFIPRPPLGLARESIDFFESEKETIERVIDEGWKPRGKLLTEISPIFSLKVYPRIEDGEMRGKIVRIRSGVKGKIEAPLKLREADRVRIRTFGPSAFSETDGLYIFNTERMAKSFCKFSQLEDGTRELVCELLE